MLTDKQPPSLARAHRVSTDRQRPHPPGQQTGSDHITHTHTHRVYEHEEDPEGVLSAQLLQPLVDVVRMEAVVTNTVKVKVQHGAVSEGGWGQTTI